MKKIIAIAVCLPVLALILAYAQPAPSPSTTPPTNQIGRYVWIPETNSLPKFDLNFPGGTPHKLVKAIEKATGKPLNAIIPVKDADVQLPPFSVRDVTVPQLFKVLELSSDKLENQIVGTYDPTTGKYNTYGGAKTEYVCQPTHFKCGFKTYGVPTEQSIWYFYRDTVLPPPQQFLHPPKICRFYSLAPYLDRGFTVDDITTAIRTGWKMAGITSLPKLEYHKETRLLIAYGEPDDLKTIDSVLHTLPASNATISDVSRMSSQINTLIKEVNKLKNRTSAPPSAAAKE